MASSDWPRNQAGPTRKRAAGMEWAARTRGRAREELELQAGPKRKKAAGRMEDTREEAKSCASRACGGEESRGTAGPTRNCVAQKATRGDVGRAAGGCSAGLRLGGSARRLGLSFLVLDRI